MPLAIVLVIFAVALNDPPRPAHAQPTLYDDFSGDKLDPDKWFGEQGVRPGEGQGGLELVRQIQDGSLLMSHRVAGGNPTMGSFVISRNRLRFPLAIANSITAAQADVTVTDFTVTKCSVPPSGDSQVDAGLVEVLFNDGSSTGPNDETGDISLQLVLVREGHSIDPPDILRATAHFIRCTNATCTTGTRFDRDLGPVSVGTTVTLRWRWDKANKAILFQKDTDDIQAFTYTFNDRHRR